MLSYKNKPITLRIGRNHLVVSDSKAITTTSLRLFHFSEELFSLIEFGLERNIKFFYQSKCIPFEKKSIFYNQYYNFKALHSTFKKH